MAINIYLFLYQTQPFPIGAAEQQDEREADERQRYTVTHEVTHLKGVRAVGNHVLRRVDVQSDEGFLGWVAGFSGDVIITAPESVRAAYKEHLQKQLEIYNREE